MGKEQGANEVSHSGGNKKFLAGDDVIVTHCNLLVVTSRHHPPFRWFQAPYFSIFTQHDTIIVFSKQVPGGTLNCTSDEDVRSSSKSWG